MSAWWIGGLTWGVTCCAKWCPPAGLLILLVASCLIYRDELLQLSVLGLYNVSFLSNRVPSQYHSVLFLLPFSLYHSLIIVICLCLLVYPACCFCCCFHRRKVSFMVILCRHDSLLFSIRCLYYRQQVSLKAVKCVLVRKFDFFQTLPILV